MGGFDVPEPLTRTPAWRSGELWAIDGSAYVSRPGPRLVDGVEVLADVLAGRDDFRGADSTTTSTGGCSAGPIRSLAAGTGIGCRA